jgi:hypothetical protein
METSYCQPSGNGTVRVSGPRRYSQALAMNSGRIETLFSLLQDRSFPIPLKTRRIAESQANCLSAFQLLWWRPSMSHSELSRRLFQSDLSTFQSNLDKLQDIAQTLPQDDARRVQLGEILQSMREIAVNMKFLIGRF